MLTNNKNKKFRGFSKKNVVDFQNFQKSNFDGGKFLEIRSSINLPWAYVMSHKIFGPDRFSRFDVYWIQTNRQTNRQTSQIYIKMFIRFVEEATTAKFFWVEDVWVTGYLG